MSSQCILALPLVNDERATRATSTFYNTCLSVYDRPRPGLHCNQYLIRQHAVDTPESPTPSQFIYVKCTGM